MLCAVIIEWLKPSYILVGEPVVQFSAFKDLVWINLIFLIKEINGFKYMPPYSSTRTCEIPVSVNRSDLATNQALHLENVNGWWLALRQAFPIRESEIVLLFRWRYLNGHIKVMNFGNRYWEWVEHILHFWRSPLNLNCELWITAVFSSP